MTSKNSITHICIFRLICSVFIVVLPPTKSVVFFFKSDLKKKKSNSPLRTRQTFAQRVHTACVCIDFANISPSGLFVFQQFRKEFWFLSASSVHTQACQSALNTSVARLSVYPLSQTEYIKQTQFACYLSQMWMQQDSDAENFFWGWIKRQLCDIFVVTA